MTSLSVVVPVYNEERFVAAVLKDLDRLQLDVPLEIVAVDDASDDRSFEILESLQLRTPLTVVRHDRNQGKGAALRTGFDACHHELCVVFDADPEYSVDDIPRLLAAWQGHRVDAVYGIRSFGGHSAFSFWYVLGNRVVTLAANVLYNSYIRDLETCLKLVPLATLREMGLRSNSFDIEAEVTAKLLRARARIFEIPVSYTARSRDEGKKLLAKDGLIALWTLLRYRFGRPVLARRRGTSAVDTGTSSRR